MPDATTTVRMAAGWLVRRARELADAGARWTGLRGGRGDSRGPSVEVPPRRLRARTGAPSVRDWTVGGPQAADELERALAEPFAAFARILDFGCGSGRVLPYVHARSPDARCTGVDVDPAAIAWASAHHPELSFVTGASEPPLPFAANSFDLVYSISVFSHLSAALQDRWLAELARVLEPAGRALLSVHGAHAFEQFRTGQVRTSWAPAGAFDRPPLGPGELVFVPYLRSVWNDGELPGVGASYGLTFHGGDYLAGHWSRWLAVEAILPRALTGWQDLVLARAQDPGAPNVERIERT